MEKLHFDSDYMRGAHPLIMHNLTATNMEQTPGYGSDQYSEKARQLIKEACQCPEARVYFLIGGTQTNSTVIDAILKNHEGVIAATTGHINVHESGAIEATGHKVLALPSHEGKLRVCDLENFIDDFYADESYEHMVAPGAVYISYPTELGTLYTKEELCEISKCCRKKNIPLFLDGARLGYALAANPEISLSDIASLCDVFYIGGTKVGALFGEAVVVTNPEILHHFVPLVKQHGALLAKGRILGIQFMTLFTDRLYEIISRNAIIQAMKLKKIFMDHGYSLYIDSPTNQQFFLLPNSFIDKLRELVTFELWGSKGAEVTPVRFVTDWATSDAEINLLEQIIDNIQQES